MSPLKHFLILLFSLAFPHFQPNSSIAVKVVIDGVCQHHCDRSRKFWHKDGPYKMFCDSAYVDEKDREKCRLDCLSCPAEVCDEYDDPNQFNCPPVTFDDVRSQQPCKERCERNRPRGHRESFDLDCYYDVSSDKQNCYKCDNGLCPKFVCESDEYYNMDYFCPATQFEGVCQDRCDRNRKIGQVDPYELDCNKQSDASRCQTECSMCPKYVCEISSSFPGGGNTYFCPTPHISTECQAICDEKRSSDYAYTLYCNDYFDSSKCLKFCSECPDFVCDNRGPNDITFYCPRREEPNIWTYNPPKKYSYKGKCKNRCDKSRGGGPQQYDLECKKRYESQEEIDLCVNDCLNECSPESCHGGNYLATIKCKANQTEVDRLEKERQDEIDSLKEEHNQKRHKLVIALIVFGVILAILIGAFVAYILYIRRKHRTGPVPYTHTSATTVLGHGQQQQVQFIPASPQLLQQKQENRQNANVTHHPQPQHQFQYPMQSSSGNSTSTPIFQQNHGNTAPSMAKSTPALHPPAEPSPQNANAAPVKELTINQAKHPSSPPEPPKATMDNRQTTPVIISTQNKPK